MIGYHASHEQFSPSELRALAIEAEQAGFEAIMCSDHIEPWSAEQGQSGFVWSWLGAAMQLTSLPFGVVTAPGWRYHPAVIAQAAATIAELFAERFWVAFGSGEALNEHITGERWPAKPERNARLRECVEVIRALWAGETVTHHGLIHVDEATVWVRPQRPPKIAGAALSVETAEFVGGWADALITINAPRDQLQSIVEAFSRGGGDGKPVFLQVHVSYAQTIEEATANALEQWKSVILPPEVNQYLRTPAHFAQAASFVTADDVAKHVRVSADPEQHLEWLNADFELGISELYLHNVNRNQSEFMQMFGERVLPELCGRRKR